MKVIFDWDGTLYEFVKDAKPEKWSAPGYARGLSELSNVTKAVRKMADKKSFDGEDIELYICTAVVSMDFAVKDKMFVAKRDKLGIPERNMVFVPYGNSKVDALKKAGVDIEPGDLFLDDYTNNLKELNNIPGLTPVKLLNGINDTHRSWKGARVSAFSTPSEIVDTLLGLSAIAKIAA